jgi:hypothetical protein
MNETYYRSTNRHNTGTTLHEDRDCRHLTNSNVQEVTDPSLYPHRDWCSHCTDKDDPPEPDAGGTLYDKLEKMDPDEVTSDA